jgi:FkbM family methyltransferase
MIKQFIKKILIALRIDLTKNIHYDRLTVKIFDKVLKPDSNCFDIGCHKGEILEEILKRSPEGKHMAFEPIPFFAKQLKEKFQSQNVEIFEVALSNSNGETTFNYVVDAPAYSGIKQRDYKIKEPKIEKLKVKLEMLDHILPKNYKVDFIKIDVEGGEFDVLKGAEKTLKKSSPIVIFEFGLGASDHYNVQPTDFFGYLNSTCNYEIYLLDAFLKSKSALSKEQFVETYKANSEYYFISSPRS